MKVRGLIDEDFTNYKKPSMYIISAFCTFKCDIESGSKICQNSSLIKDTEIIEVSELELVKRYLNNKITKAIVFGGLEPIDTFADLVEFIIILREQFHCDDDVVIYTGYTEDEISKELTELKNYVNIVVKFGRFIPNQKSHLDEILGVELASPNQYAKKIS